MDSLFSDHLATWLGNDLIMLILGMVYVELKSRFGESPRGKTLIELGKDLKEQGSSTEASMLKRLIQDK